MQENKNNSIHPRVENGRTRYDTVNTAMPRRNGVSPAKRRRMETHMAAHPNDRATAGHLSKQ